MNERITVEEAARMLGLNPHTVRKGMRDGSFNPPIGRVRKSGKIDHFDIYRNMVNEYRGVKE